MLYSAPFPLSIDQIDESFLSEGLNQNIDRFSYQRIGADRGMLGEIFKITIESDTGTRDIVAKFSSQRKEALENSKRGGNHERELRCYDELLSETPISFPEIYCCWFDAESSEYLLLQEFIEFDQNVDQINGITVQQSKLVISEAAKMHAYWWENERLELLGWLPRLTDARRRTNLTTVTKMGWEPLTEILEERQIQFPEISGEHLAEKIDHMLNTVADFPSTLIHSDLRADNLLFDSTGEGVTVVDWQGCSFAPSSFDITYHLIQSLSIPDRRKYETELLEHYITCLRSSGLQVDGSEIYDIYRKSILYSLSIACAIPLINDIEIPRVKDLAFSMATRTLAGLEDHNITLTE